MKTLAILAAAVALIATGTMSFAFGPPTQSARGVRSVLYLHLPSASRVPARWAAVALQTGGTATGTVTTTTPGTTTAVPGTTPTTSPYPDPVTVLQNMIAVFQRVTTSHFKNVTDAKQTTAALAARAAVKQTSTTIEELTINQIGDATCKGPSLKMSVTGKDTLVATKQSRSYKGQFIQVKNKTWEKAKSTKNKWKSVNGNNVTVLGFPAPVQNPLICPSTSSSGSGSSGSSGSGGTTDQIKDLVNNGPVTFQGKSMWDIKGTDVRIDAQGNTISLPFDFLISQSGYLPYSYTQTLNDTTDHVILVEKQILTKFGEKVTVKAPA